jgi:hypothetical protein
MPAATCAIPPRETLADSSVDGKHAIIMLFFASGSMESTPQSIESTHPTILGPLIVRRNLDILAHLNPAIWSSWARASKVSKKYLTELNKYRVPCMSRATFEAVLEELGAAIAGKDTMLCVGVYIYGAADADDHVMEAHGGGGRARMFVQQVRVKPSQSILILNLSCFRSVDPILVSFVCLGCEFGACLRREGFERVEE